MHHPPPPPARRITLLEMQHCTQTAFGGLKYFPIFFPGAFLIPYFLCLAIAGIPIFFIELGIGQRLRRGSVACWNEISPYLGGIGIGCMVVSFLVSVYYNMIIGWSFYYMFISMQEKLPFESCDSYPHITPGKASARI